MTPGFVKPSILAYNVSYDTFLFWINEHTNEMAQIHQMKGKHTCRVANTLAKIYAYMQYEFHLDS